MKRLFLFLLLTGASISAQEFSSLLPDSIEEWKAEDKGEIYNGEELYRLVDGGADLFNEYGFGRVIARRYLDPYGGNISVEIYEMDDSAAAFGIFSLITFNTGNPIEFNCEAYAGEGFMLFQKGKYYVSLSGNESSAAVQNALIQFSSLIEKNIEPLGKPLLVRKLEELNYLRIAYFKGNLGFYNVTSLLGKGLRFEEGICLKMNGVNYTILKFNSAESREVNFKTLCSILEAGGKYKIIESSYSSALFKDDRLTYCRLNQFLEFIIISSISGHEKEFEIPEKIENILRR